MAVIYPGNPLKLDRRYRILIHRLPYQMLLVATLYICHLFYLPFFLFHVRFQPKKEMLSLNISRYSKPSAYRVSELPKPRLANSKDVIIKVYAAGINPIDVKRAAGALKLAVEDP